MIYDLKAEGRDLTTRAGPICRGSPQRHRDRRGAFGLLERHDLDFILRGLRAWVPKRIIPRLGALSVVNTRAKQTQFLASRAAGAGRLCKTNPISPPGGNPESGPPAGLLIQTNPTSPGEIPRYSTVLSFHHSNPMPIMRNEPNSAIADSQRPAACPQGLRGRLYKQTQSGPTSRKAGARRAKCTKRTQFGRSGGAPEGEMCETNPIPGDAT
jgi:hypothetical protein